MSFDLKIINGDLVINQGQLQQVIDSEKLIQDILKICITNAGSNPLHPGYGSFLSRSIIGSAMDSSILVQIGKNQLNSTLENLKTLQQIQVQSMQRVSADEQLSAILDISVKQSQTNLTMYEVSVRATTKGLRPITTAFRISTI